MHSPPTNFNATHQAKVMWNEEVLYKLNMVEFEDYLVWGGTPGDVQGLLHGSMLWDIS